MAPRMTARERKWPMRWIALATRTSRRNVMRVPMSCPATEEAMTARRPHARARARHCKARAGTERGGEGEGVRKWTLGLGSACKVENVPPFVRADPKNPAAKAGSERWRTNSGQESTGITKTS